MLCCFHLVSHFRTQNFVEKFSNEILVSLRERGPNTKIWTPLRDIKSQVEILLSERKYVIKLCLQYLSPTIFMQQVRNMHFQIKFTKKPIGKFHWYKQNITSLQRCNIVWWLLSPIYRCINYVIISLI